MKPKLNWKQKCLAAEKERNAAVRELIEADKYAKSQYRAYDTELAARPVVEKIVEREVLPWWVLPVIIALWLPGLYAIGRMGWQVNKLQSPILKPYAVYITKQSKPIGFTLEVSHDKPKHHEPKVTSYSIHTFSGDCPSGFERMGDACAQTSAAPAPPPPAESEDLGSKIENSGVPERQ